MRFAPLAFASLVAKPWRTRGGAVGPRLARGPELGEPGRRTEKLDSWEPESPRCPGRFPDSQLADSPSLPATAAAVIALASRPCPNSRCRHQQHARGASPPHARIHTRNRIGCRYTARDMGADE